MLSLCVVLLLSADCRNLLFLLQVFGNRLWMLFSESTTVVSSARHTTWMQVFPILYPAALDGCSISLSIIRLNKYGPSAFALFAHSLLFVQL